MRRNSKLQHSTVSELSTLARNEGGRRVRQNIYKCISTITGIDPYWFQTEGN